MSPARRGSALPFVLGALTVSLVAAASAAAVARGAGREARGTAAALQASAAADGALAATLARWPARWNLALAPGEVAERDVASAAGPARVHALRLDAHRFALEAEGRALGTAAPDEGPAVRRHALLVRLAHVAAPSAAAVTAGGPVTVQGGATVAGADQVPAGWSNCPGATADSVAVAAPAAAGPGALLGAVRTDSAAWAPALAPRLGALTYAALAQAADVRVVAAAGGHSPVPRASGAVLPAGDVGGEPCALDGASWGEPRRGGAAAEPSCEGAWPVVHVAGAVARLVGPARLQGTLLVDGDLEVDGLVEASGLVVVTGAVRVAGALVLDGALVAGGSVDLGAGSRVRAASCATSRAAAYAARASPLTRRSWAVVHR